jgi:hypothetical protein
VSESERRAVQNVIVFLEENEQYGDDWSAEIKTLKGLLES